MFSKTCKQFGALFTGIFLLEPSFIQLLKLFLAMKTECTFDFPLNVRLPNFNSQSNSKQQKGNGKYDHIPGLALDVGVQEGRTHPANSGKPQNAGGNGQSPLRALALAVAQQNCVASSSTHQLQDTINIFNLIESEILTSQKLRCDTDQFMMASVKEPHTLAMMTTNLGM